MKSKKILVFLLGAFAILYFLASLLLLSLLFYMLRSCISNYPQETPVSNKIEEKITNYELESNEGDVSTSQKVDDQNTQQKESVPDEIIYISQNDLDELGIKFKGDFYFEAEKTYCLNIDTPVISDTSKYGYYLTILQNDGSQVFDSALNTLKSKEINIDTDKFLGDIQIYCNKDNGEIIDELLVTKPDYFDEMRSILSYSHGGSMNFDIHDFVLEIRIIALKGDYLFNMEYLIFPFELVTRDEVSHCFDKDMPDIYNINRECVIEKIMSKESANLEILDRAYDLLNYYELN